MMEHVSVLSDGLCKPLKLLSGLRHLRPEQTLSRSIQAREIVEAPHAEFRLFFFLFG